MATLKEKLFKRTQRTSGCWIWVGHVNNQGYGRFFNRANGSHRSAHLLMYETLVGKVPRGLQLDHLCRNTRCVNPSHLEPVTPRENTLRSPVAPAAINSRKTHCINGHKFDGDNTYHPPKFPGKRHCKVCQAGRVRAFQLKLREA